MRDREKLYRDNIHIDIKWDSLATKIVNTAEFQRLAGIKQLGFAELVYRGAKHTRFEHSIGTYWLAKRIIQCIPMNHLRLGINFPHESEFSGQLGTGAKFIDKVSRIVSYAGLLHDIAHIPFGHTLEDEFQDIYDYKHDHLESTRLPYILFDNRSEISRLFERDEPWVEDLSNATLRWLLAMVICYKDEVGKPAFEKERERSFDEILGEIIEPREERRTKDKKKDNILSYLKDLRTNYINFRQQKLYHPFMSDVVANTICADILDYIRRDIYATGLEMDYDDRIYQYFILGKEIIPGGQAWRLALCIRDPLKQTDKMDIATEVLNILGHRYTLAERIYYHKSKVAAGAMLAKAISLVKDWPKDPDLDYPSSKVDGVTLDKVKGRENHVLAVHMTDDGYLRWIEDKALEASGKDKQGSQLLLSKEQIQGETGTDNKSSDTRTPEDNGSVNHFDQALGLVDNIRRRRLYKPVVIITRGVARHERRVSYFTTKYGGRNKCEKIERLLASQLKMREDSLVIYCPRPTPQTKQIETRVLVDSPTTIQPLWDDDRFREQASDITKRYEHLWKLFVFLHPEEYKSPIIRQMVTEKFREFEGFEKINAREIAPYQWMEKDQIDTWENYKTLLGSESTRLWHSGLEELIQHTQHWEYMKGRSVVLNEGDSSGVLDIASGALYLYDYVISNNQANGQSRPSWLGLSNILDDCKLASRIFSNLDWKSEVSTVVEAASRDKTYIDRTTAITNAYYATFKKWSLK